MRAADYLERLERDMTGGFLHLLVLEHLRRHAPIHGYGLIRAMEADQAPGQWKEGTIYPLLATFEKEGLITSRWGVPGSGARRKYYEMTSAGEEVRDLAVLKWNRLRDRLDTILEKTP
jgi:PadR family transcriptional regulator PadR